MQPIDEKQKLIVQKEIDQQMANIERLLDKRETTGLHLNDFLGEERARLYGMFQIYWLLGGDGYKAFRQHK
jgi:hypothetical protein